MHSFLPASNNQHTWIKATKCLTHVHGRILHSSRDRIPEATAVYLCKANTANVERIVADLAACLYPRLSINFTDEIERSLMERFASLAAGQKQFQNIFQVSL